MSIKVEDHGYIELMKNLGNAKKSLLVGIVDDSEHPSGKTVSEIAMNHEFGIGVPQRSWLRDFFDFHLGDITPEMVDLGKKIFNKKIPVEKALDAWGKHLVRKMKQRIQSGIGPPNSKQTIDRKGSDTPLIETGTFLNHISYKIEDSK
jgi:hypothetical protein